MGDQYQIIANLKVTIQEREATIAARLEDIEHWKRVVEERDEKFDMYRDDCLQAYKEIEGYYLDYKRDNVELTRVQDELRDRIVYLEENLDMSKIEIEDYDKLKHQNRKTIADHLAKIGGLQKDNAHLTRELEGSIQENKEMIEQFENYRTRKEEHIIVLLNNIKKIQKDFKIIKQSYEEDMAKSHEKIRTLT